jgi:hypothetical protein
MLIILPLLTFALLFFDLLGVHSRRKATLTGLRGVFLITVAFSGGLVLIFSEILSLFRLLAQPWMASCWGLAALAAGWLGWRQGWMADGWRCLRTTIKRPEAFDLVCGGMLALILILLFLVAVIAPVNNDDSLQYHMSRVMHWTQDRSLSFYATPYEAQLYNPIWAELALLNTRQLEGSDKHDNLVQWASLVGALIGVSVLARLFGAGR